MNTPIPNQQGYDAPPEQVSEWVDDFVVSFSAPKNGLIKLQTNPDLQRRKLYIYINSQTQTAGGVEFWFDAVVKFFLNSTPVGSFPTSFGSGGVFPPVSFTRPRVCIATANINGPTPGADIIGLTPVSIDLDVPALALNPQNFYGKFDTIQVDVTAMANTGNCTYWIGCMSTQK